MANLTITIEYSTPKELWTPEELEGQIMDIEESILNTLSETTTVKISTNANDKVYLTEGVEV